MDSRSGPAEVLRQETYVVARLLGAVDLERQAEEGLSIRPFTIERLGIRRDVSVSGAEVAGWSLVGQDFNPCVACGYLGPCGFLPCSPQGLSSRKWVGEGHRLEPEDLGLRWKEGVRMMKSYRTCLTTLSLSWRRG